MPLTHCYRSLAGKTEWFSGAGTVEFKPFEPFRGRARLEASGMDAWFAWAGPTLMRLDSGVWLLQTECGFTTYREIPENEASEWFRDHHAHLRFNRGYDPVSSNGPLTSWEVESGFPSSLFLSREAARLRVPGGVPGAARRLAERIRVLSEPPTDRLLMMGPAIEAVQELHRAIPQPSLSGISVFNFTQEAERENALRALREILSRVVCALGGEIDAPTGLLKMSLGTVSLDFDDRLPEALDRFASRLDALDESTNTPSAISMDPAGGGHDVALKTGTEGTASSGTVAPPVLPIVLGGPDDGPTLRGKQKNRMTPGQYRVVKALLDAHPERLSKDTLARRSDTESPIGMIDRLRRDPDWASVLDKPGQAHGGYGIRVKPLRKAAPRKG